MQGFPLDREVQISGAIGLVRGLEYHHRNFMERVALLAPFLARITQPPSANPTIERIPNSAEFEIIGELDHEAVAYLNRVGQLYFFAKSLGLVDLLPEASALIPFRHKHTAHRSVDEPRKESAEELQQQAMAFGFGHRLDGGFPNFWIANDGKWITFVIKDSHPKLLQQAVTLFEAIFPLPDGT